MSHGTVASRGLARMSPLVAALKNSDVLGCNVPNAFLSADDLKKHHLIAGDEFGHKRSKISQWLER